MVSLIVLSMVLSVPSGPANAAIVVSDPLAVSPPPIALTRPDTPLFVEEPQLDIYDKIEIQPDSDICYKIRAYVFSTEAVPKLIRETTCGPKRARTKSIEGSEPKLMPLDVKPKPSPVPDR